MTLFMTLADKFAKESRSHLRKELALARMIDHRVHQHSTFIEYEGRRFELVWLIFGDGSFALQNYGVDTLMIGMMTADGPTGP